MILADEASFLLDPCPKMPTIPYMGPLRLHSPNPYTKVSGQGRQLSKCLFRHRSSKNFTTLLASNGHRLHPKGAEGSFAGYGRVEVSGRFVDIAL